MRYLLDTNICIYLIKRRPSEVLERFRQHSPQDVAISTITLFELQYGIEKSGVNYREAYGMYACNGILFNHEPSPKLPKYAL